MYAFLQARIHVGFLYRFCTAVPAILPFMPIEPIGGSITYMFSTLLHSSIPTGSTIPTLLFQQL